MEKTLLLIGFALIFWSCSGKNEREAPAVEPTLSKVETVAIPMNDFGLPLAIEVPLSRKKDFKKSWNENFGRLEVSASGGVDFFISESDLTLSQKKFEIESNIFIIEYIVEEPDLLIYEARLPDGSISYFNFFSIYSVAGIQYTAENNPLAEFTKEEILNMVELIKTIRLFSDKDL